MGSRRNGKGMAHCSVATNWSEVANRNGTVPFYLELETLVTAKQLDMAVKQMQRTAEAKKP